ncbi:MAG: sugar phosphate nucleotidyltransferase [Chloroflexi bacterium]|nr:sugar phosphate nucleotidyltransferase [Chloroflexota bacterium]
MKGIILAGGKGTRLNPLTEITNKHLLPVGREPMIWHPVKQLVSAGIVDLMVITSTEHMGDVVNSLGSGRRFGCEFTYRVQEQAGGIAEALSLAERFANGERIVVLLGDNIFEYSIKPYVREFEKQEKGARVLIKEVNEPEHYGVAALDEKQILEIEEKPNKPKSNFAVLGCYMYDNQIFDIIKQTGPSARGELEITTVNNIYIHKGQLEYSIISGRWTDAGTFQSLNQANRILLESDNKILQ